MTDVMREMIQQLMGAQRAEEEGRSLPPYDHHSVCRAYLYGNCPAEILVRCTKLHEPALKGEYEREQEKKDHYYDIETYEQLTQAIRVVDADINKIRDKIERDNKDHSDSMEYVKTQKMHDINEHIGKALARMEELGSEGKVEESMQLSRTVEELKQQKEQIAMDLRSYGGGLNTRQQLRVCEDCGAQLNLLDHETRLADHFGGKMHLGMVDIRAKFDEMKDNIEERKEARKKLEGSRVSEREREREKDRDRRRSPDRRDRDRERGDRSDRDRKKDRSRSRDRNRRSRSRDRERSSRSSRDSRDRRDRR